MGIVGKYDVDMGHRVVIVKGVPGFECIRCGEISYSDEVAGKLEEIVRDATGTEEIIVAEYDGFSR